MSITDVQKETVANLLSELTGISSIVLLNGIFEFGYAEIISNPLLLNITQEETLKLTNLGLLLSSEEAVK